MKKLFFGLTIFLILIFASAYFILFTSTGNSFVSSYAEKKINESQNQVNIKIDAFKLTMKDILLKATLDNNSVIDVVGKLNIFSKSVDLKYNVNIKDLSKLKKFTKQQLNGSFSTSGILKGDQTLAKLVGKTNIASGNIDYDVNLVDFKPAKILYKMKNTKIQDLLHLLNQPIYANGLLNIDANIKNADVNNLDGKIITNISNAYLNNPIINKAFNQKLKDKVNIKADINTNLNGTKAVSNAKLITSLANVTMKKLVYDIKNMTLTSDYFINLFDLSKLKDISGHKMRGTIDITGKIKQNKKILSLDGNSSIFDGKFSFNLLNDNFKAKVDSAQIKSILHMMYYPEIFDSKSNIDLSYNLKTKVGKVNTELLNGQFVKNQFSSIINTFAKFDLTKEVYKSTTIKSDIDKNIINSVLEMKSKNTIISVPASTIDTEKKTINALVQTKILKYNFDTTIKGDINKPKIKVDTSKFLKNKLKNKIKEKLKKKLNGFNLDKLFNKNDSINKQKAPASNEEIAEAFHKFFGNN